MKKIAAVAIVSAFVSIPSFAADTGYFVGVKLGRTDRSSPSSANMIMTKSTDTVGGILGGYQFTKNWGVEGFYTGAGRVAARNAAYTTSASRKTDVFGINIVGTLPVYDVFSVYGKLGFASARTSTSSVPASNLAGKTRNASTYGFGGKFNVTPVVDIRLGWDRYYASTTGGTGIAGVVDDFRSDVYSVDAVFKL